MINYTELTNYLVEVAERNPNVQFVEFNTDIDSVNKPTFVTPAFIISPSPTTLQSNSVVNYQFQLLYLDKLTQEEDNYSEVLETGLQNIMSYIQVIDIDYKIVYDIVIDPIILGFEGGIVIGQQAQIIIQDQYNLDKFNSVYYAS